MSRKFKLHKRYYGEEYDLYKKGTITIEKGVTILVGCNGSGKTTLLRQIKDSLEKENIPVLHFDNLNDGGSKAVASASFYNDFAYMATAMQSSEGENIILNIGKLASTIRPFIKTGKSQTERDRFQRGLAEALYGKKEEENEISNERWILLDAVDSGLSVDNIVDLKGLFDAIFEDNPDNDIYIVVSANEYELCRGEHCFDVYNGKYVSFADYEAYRSFILESRETKNKRQEAFGNK